MNRTPELLDKDRITPRRGPGPRTKRRLAQRRASRKKGISLTLVVGGVSAGVIAAASFLIPLFVKKGGDAIKPKTPATRVQETWLALGTVEADQSGDADWIMVVSWHRAEKRGFVMYVPRTTLVEIPGFGGSPEVIAKAMSLGKDPLTLSTMSNLLGVRFDHHLRISDQATQALFDKAGGLKLDIEQRLSRTEEGGRVKTIFADGEQHLNGERISEYLEFVDETGDEVSRAVRHTQIWAALLEKFRTENKNLGELFGSSRDLFITDASAEDLTRFFGNFTAEPVQFETMPVQAQGVDTGTQFYRAESDSISKMVEKYLAGSRAAGFGEPGRRIQILNGNGVPGIGQEVAEKLVPKGFRVVLDANAKSFDYDVTQIVVYSNSRQSLTLADEIRKALGVGEVLISRQHQGVVDITLVVGKDYLKKR